MGSKNDELYKCFENHLYSYDFDEPESHDDFIDYVVDQYWNIIQSLGHVAASYKQEIRKDLQSEVKEMLQKKIYGHFSLQAFRRSLNRES